MTQTRGRRLTEVLLAAVGGPLAGIADAELLGRYAAGRDEVAFVKVCFFHR